MHSGNRTKKYRRLVLSGRGQVYPCLCCLDLPGEHLAFALGGFEMDIVHPIWDEPFAVPFGHL
jgi:hypothetical protein